MTTISRLLKIKVAFAKEPCERASYIFLRSMYGLLEFSDVASLRVEFLLKTESGYLRDAEVT